jgi:hypothetical protein
VRAQLQHGGAHGAGQPRKLREASWACRTTTGGLSLLTIVVRVQAFTAAHAKTGLSGAKHNTLLALSALALPFQPMVVAGVHTIATEVAFTKASMKDPKHKADQIIHTASTLAALTCFKAENKFKHNPLLHSMWHVFGAIAIYQANKVIM